MIKKRDLYALIIGLFLILMCHFMYLINLSDGVWLVLFVAFFGTVFLKYFRVKVESPQYSKIIILGIMMILISSFRANSNVGQSILAGLDGQKIFGIILLSYFPLQKLIARDKISIKLLENFIVVFGIIQSFIYILQHYLYSNIVFLHTMINIRNGARIYADSVVIELMIMVAFSRVLSNSEKTIKNVLILMLGLFYEFIVAQGRLESMAILFVLSISFLIYRGHSGKKIVVFSVITIIAIWFFNSELLTNFMTTEYNTMEIRDVARELYYSRLMESPGNFIFGYGYLSSGYADVIKFAGTRRTLYVEDAGIFGLVYSYGILGATFVLALFMKNVKLSFELFRKRGEVVPFMFMLLNIVLAYNIVFWWWKSEWIFVMVFFMCLLERLNYSNANSALREV